MISQINFSVNLIKKSLSFHITVLPSVYGTRETFLKYFTENSAPLWFDSSPRTLIN